jgi:hypothetical protein
MEDLTGDGPVASDATRGGCWPPSKGTTVAWIGHWLLLALDHHNGRTPAYVMGGDI